MNGGNKDPGLVDGWIGNTNCKGYAEDTQMEFITIPPPRKNERNIGTCWTTYLVGKQNIPIVLSTFQRQDVHDMCNLRGGIWRNQKMLYDHTAHHTSILKTQNHLHCVSSHWKVPLIQRGFNWMAHFSIHPWSIPIRFLSCRCSIQINKFWALFHFYIIILIIISSNTV